LAISVCMSREFICLVQTLQDSSIYMCHVNRNEWLYMYMELRWAPNIHISMSKPKWGNTGQQAGKYLAYTIKQMLQTCNHLSMHAYCCSPAARFGQVRSTSNHIVGYTPMNSAPHPPRRIFLKKMWAIWFRV
jgi:hypothetical protein